MKELDEGWQILKGELPILVIAAHNFNQIREDKEKVADLGTGDISRNLCEKFNLWGIVSTRIQSDPNWDIHSAFRQQVREIIKTNNIVLVIDVHGSKLGSEELISISTNKVFWDKYDLFELEIPMNLFKDDDQYTICEELENEVAAIQLEIREDGRVNTIDPEIFESCQKKLDQLIEFLTTQFPKE